MKNIILILLLFCGLSSYGQIMQTNGTPGGYQWVAVKADTLLIIPNGPDTPAIGPTKFGKSTKGAIFYKTTDSTFWVRSAYKWNQISGSGGPTTINWGDILGDITNQTDLIDYITNYVATHSGISSLGQGYGVIIVNDSTYDVDTSLIATQYFVNTSIINALASDSDHLVGDYPIVLSRSGDTIFIALDSAYKAITLTDGLKSGGIVSWTGSGLTFDVTAAIYVIGGVLYYSPAGQFTLSDADEDNPRIDVPVVNTLSAVDVKEGDPAAQPVEPQPDPATQIGLTSITVPAGAIEPGVTVNTIYDQDTTGEWTHTTTGTVSFSNTTNPKHLTIAADMSSYATTRTITFTHTGNLDRLNYTLLKFYVDLKANMAAASNIQVRFYNGATAVTNAITITAAHGFTKTDVGYQTITVPLSSIAFTSNTFTKIVWTFTGAGSGLYFDWAQLQGGIDPGGPATGVTIVTASNTYGLNWSITNPTTTPNLTATIDTTKISSINNVIKKIDSIQVVNSGLYVPLVRTITINGVTFDLSANRTWTVTPSLTDTYIGVGNASNQLSGSNALTYSGSGLTVHNIANGTAGTDSVLVQSNGIIKKIAANYYGAAGAGITTLNTLTAATQTFATGTSGSDFNISSATSTHTFNLPTASASNRGALSSADWTTFNNKQNAISGIGYSKWAGSSVSFDAVIPIAGGGTNNGSLSVTNGGIAYFDGTKMVALPIGGAGQHLVVVGGVPTWRDTAAVVGNAGWSTTGNAGTTAGTNFIGTTDAIDFVTKTNGTERSRFLSTGFYGINESVPTAYVHVKGGSGDPAYSAEFLTSSGWTTTNWTGGPWPAGWTHTTGNTSVASRTGAAVIGTTYRIGYVVTGRTAGSVTITFGGLTSGAVSTNVSDQAIGAATTTATLAITPTSTFDGTVTISIVSITGNSTPIQIWKDVAGNAIELRTDTSGNIGLGSGANGKNLDGYKNVAMGLDALSLNLSGAQNTALGWNTLKVLAAGGNTSNTAVGSSALSQNTTGTNNTASGSNAGVGNSTGNYNIFIGAVNGNSNGTGRILISSSPVTVTGGNYTTTVGSVISTPDIWSSGVENTNIGAAAGISRTTANTATKVTAIGANALIENQGDGNTALGHSAGGGNYSAVNEYFNQSTYDTYIGTFAGLDQTQNTSGNGNIVIGAGSKKPTSTSSNTITFDVGIGATGVGTTYNALTRFKDGEFLINGTTSRVTTAPNASALLELNGTTRGFLLPRLTKTQRDAISSPATGLMIYQTDNTPGLRVYNGTNWMRFTETAD